MLEAMNNKYIQKWEYSGYTIVKVKGSSNYSIQCTFGNVVNVLTNLDDCRRFIDFICCK